MVCIFNDNLANIMEKIVASDFFDSVRTLLVNYFDLRLNVLQKIPFFSTGSAWICPDIHRAYFAWT